MTRAAVRSGVVAGIAIAAIGGLAALAATGEWPRMENYVHFEPDGIVSLAPEDITRIELLIGRRPFVLTRLGPKEWANGKAGAPLSDEAAAHIAMALRFLHVSAPTRILGPESGIGPKLREFGLDPAGYRISLYSGYRPVKAVDFGGVNPSRTAQYVRVEGEDGLYLMPRHVGAEWQAAATDIMARTEDGAERDGVAPPHPLVAMPVERLSAVEVITGGKTYRLQRDEAKRWFLHNAGVQHLHVGPDGQHLADPTQAAKIQSALTLFRDIRVQQVVAPKAGRAALADFGLARPSVIVLLFAGNEAAPSLTIGIGDLAADRFSRYMHLRDTGAVVMVPDYQARMLTELLKDLGALS